MGISSNISLEILVNKETEEGGGKNLPVAMDGILKKLVLSLLSIRLCTDT
jgi:hypothetical protein